MLGRGARVGAGCPAVAAAGQPVTIPFPRLAMYSPASDTQPAAARAAYDYIVLQSADADHIAELRAANPDILVFTWGNARNLFYSTTSYDHPYNVELRSASTDWMLTKVGSTLKTAITDTSGTTIATVQDGSGTLFAVGDMVLIGGTLASPFTGDSPTNRTTELAIVAASSANTVTLTRGQFWPKKTHPADTRIATVEDVWGQHPEMNLWPTCPTVNVGYGPETWFDFNVRRAHTALHAADGIGQTYDGIHIDCFGGPGLGAMPSFDPTRTNTNYTNQSAYIAACSSEQRQFASDLRAAIGEDAIVVPNGNLTTPDLNGQLFETFPTTGTSLSLWNYVVPGPWYSEYGAVWGAPYLDWLDRCPLAAGLDPYDLRHIDELPAHALRPLLGAPGRRLLLLPDLLNRVGRQRPVLVRRVRRLRRLADPGDIAPGTRLSRPADRCRLLGRLQRVAPRLHRRHRAREPRHRRPYRQPGRHLPQDQGHPGAHRQRRQPRHGGHPAAAGRHRAARATTGSDTTPPSVSITSPANGSVVSGLVNIAALASDNVGVTRVEFRVDGTLAR